MSHNLVTYDLEPPKDCVNIFIYMYTHIYIYMQ